MRKKIKIGRILVFLFLTFIAVGTIAPFIYMVLTTFKEKNEYIIHMFSMPESLNLKNYKVIFKNYNILQLNKNSLIITAGSLVGMLTVTTMAGFAVSKLKFTGKRILYALMAFCMIMPGQVVMIPVYTLMSKLGLVNSHLSVILIYITTSIPFATFLFAANCSSVNDGIIESAKIEGASIPVIYLRIILPMIKPTIAAVAILNFVSYWNELFWAMILLQEDAKRTLTVGLVSLTGRFGSNMPLTYTGLLINCIPIIIVFFIFQKQLIKGTSAGAMK